MSPSVVQIVQESATCAYVIVPALTILVYDIIRVFPREVAYIWSAKWQGSKFLYVAVRYLALLGLWSEIMVFLKHQSSIANCRLFIWWHITFGGPALMSILVNCILALRLYALYERKKSVLVVLCSLIATEILCHIYVIVRLGPMVTNSVFTLPPEIPVLGCLTAGPPLRFTLIAWVPAVVLALIFFSMMVYKIQSQIFISIRQSKALALNSGPGMCFSPLLKTFWMDGISSFVLVSASTIISTVLYLSTTGPFLALSQPWQTLIVSVSGTRLLLHIREVSASGDPLSVGVSRPLEPIRFASRNLDQNANLSMTPDVHHSVR